MAKKTKASRKFQRIAIKKARKAARAALRGHTCDEPGCEKAAAVKHECKACEAKDKAFIVYGCHQHSVTTLHQVRRHALVKHPGNMVAAVGAALAGEDVF